VATTRVIKRGNLGKGWNELDLVPHRLIARNGNSGTPVTYNVIIAADYKTSGKIGYDSITEPQIIRQPQLNAFSDSSCRMSSTVMAERAGVTGGVDVVIYRILTITQNSGTTCVIDWANRLALGASQYPGSSLQSYMFEQEDFKTGKKTVSIPVRQAVPQSLSKNMTADQDVDYVWSISKSPHDATVNFGDVCDPEAVFEKQVKVNIEWKILPGAFGWVTVVTKVYATNPASRTVTVDVTDVIRGNTGGGVVTLDTAASGRVDVPANTTQLVLTHTYNAPYNVTSLSDVATAMYFDKVTGLPIPGTTTATASAPVRTNVQDSVVNVKDEESITGEGLSFSVDEVTVDPIFPWSFTNYPALGEITVGPVNWQALGQTACANQDGCKVGAVEFTKTVKLDQKIKTSGMLTDTAVVARTTGETIDSDEAFVEIYSDASVKLTITKTIPDPSILTGQETLSFVFDVCPAGGMSGDCTGSYISPSPTITFAAGDSASKSVTIGGLAPGYYRVYEQPVKGFSPESNPQYENINLPTCAGSLTFANTTPQELIARAKVKKVTAPAGSEAGWSFTLSTDTVGCDDPNETKTTTGTGFETFEALLKDGCQYTITETAQAGWEKTGESGKWESSSAPAGTCEFWVNYPQDYGDVFECVMTNTRETGSLKITKSVSNPDEATLPAAFTGMYDCGTGYTGTWSVAAGGSQTISGIPTGNTCSVVETAPAAITGYTWGTVTYTPSSIVISTKGETFEIVVTNSITRDKGSLKITKVVNGGGAGFTGSFGVEAVCTGDGGTHKPTVEYPAPGFVTITDIPAGNTCTVTETSKSGAPDGYTWAAEIISGSPATISKGGTAEVTVTNTVTGLAKVVKTVSGQAPAAGQTFTFQLRKDASTTSDGTVLEQKNTDASGDISFTTVLLPGQTYQICEWVFPGWNTNLAGDGPLFVPNSIIPPALPNPNVDNLTVCANFTAAAGTTRTFNVDNTPPPGGRALTIGFWKNWASCSTSKGGQKWMLDLALGIATAMTPNPPDGLVMSAQNAGSGWPDYAAIRYLILKGDPSSTIDNIKAAPDCSKAVNLLNKSTIDGKKKMSSDPLFNMAAQLVAAEANRFMGAAVSGVTITNIDRAVLLLGKYKFNGLPYTPKLSTADANLANCLATQLDNYNNNRPVSSCP